MGRREKEITTSNTGLRQLAEWLRMQRSRTCLTYRELADRAGVHATTLQRAASGASVPPLASVLAYTRACDAQPEDARRLWRQARREHVRGQTVRRPAPSPRLVRDFADLSAALQDVYEQAGAPPLRTMEKRAGEFGALPRSSAHRMVNKQAVPHSLEQFRGFLRACEVPPDWKVWEDAWNRAWRFAKEEEAGLKEVWSAAAQRNEPAQVVRAVRSRQGVEEDVWETAGDGDKMHVTARGPEYYRPMVPRQRSTSVRTPAKIEIRTVAVVARRSAQADRLQQAVVRNNGMAKDALPSWAEQTDSGTLF
ncbi:helix-turn-helix transcriptional regulator [Streptomyces sp. NPDC050392]|uniref:helix-turn-helix domain-containing protein n=1 Tax=Streptomyces sp. NPDC050392 TaxID=3155782 RepID=UPI0034135953